MCVNNLIHREFSNPYPAKLIIEKENLRTENANRATNGSAGMDLYACIDEKITINPGQLVLVPTGIAIELPRPLLA